VKEQLDLYAKFIDSTPSYVITEALKVLFKRDDEFKAWLGQQPSNGKIHELKGGGLKETAQHLKNLVRPSWWRTKPQRSSREYPV